MVSTARDSRPVVAHAKYKICFGRITVSPQLLTWIVIVHLFLLVFLLVVFLHIIPSGIKQSYEKGLRFENVRLSDWTFFQDQEHHASIQLDGESIHPDPFWGCRGVLETWHFLNQSDLPLFDPQSIEETALPNEPLRKRFTSQMKFRLSDDTSKDVKVHSILKALLHQNNDAIKEIELGGRFYIGNAVRYYLTFKVSYSVLRRGFNASELSKLETKEDFVIPGFEVKHVHLSLLEEGIRMEIDHNMQNSLQKVHLPMGAYPIYANTTPVMVLSTSRDIHLEQNHETAQVKFDLFFLKALMVSGRTLFNALRAATHTGHVELQLKGPAMATRAGWAIEDFSDTHRSAIEFTILREVWAQLQGGFRRMRFHILQLAVQGNQVFLTPDVRLPMNHSLQSFSVDFGVQFKCVLQSVAVVTAHLSHVVMQPRGPLHRSLQFELRLTFPQHEAAIQTLYDVYTALFGQPHASVQMAIDEIQFFPVKHAAPRAPTCAWCDPLFSDVQFTGAWTTHALKSQLDATLGAMSLVHAPSLGALVWSQASLSNKAGLGIFTFEATLDLSHLGLTLEALRLPALSLAWGHKNVPLGTVHLPNGFAFDPSTRALTTLHLEVRVKDDPRVQHVFAEFFELLLDQQAVKDPLQFHGLTLMHVSDSLRTFQPYQTSFTLSEISHLIRAHTRSALFDTTEWYTLSPSTLHLDVWSSDHYFVSTQLQVHPPIPLSLDFTPISWRMIVFDQHAFHLILPALKVDEGSSLVRIERAYLRSEPQPNFEVKQIALNPFEPKSIIPSHARLSSFRFLGENEAGNMTSSFSSLNSFSHFQYILDLDKNQVLGAQLDFKNLNAILRDFILLSITLQNFHFKSSHEIILDFELDYALNENVSIDIETISFDLVVHEKRQYHCQIDVQKTQVSDKRRLNLHILIEKYTGPYAVAKECPMNNGKERTFCVQKIAFGDEKARSAKTFFPIVLVFTDTTILNYLVLYHPYLSVVPIHINNEIRVSPGQFWEHLATVVFKASSVDDSAYHVLSFSVSIEGNALILDVGLQLPLWSRRAGKVPAILVHSAPSSGKTLVPSPVSSASPVRLPLNFLKSSARSGYILLSAFYWDTTTNHMQIKLKGSTIELGHFWTTESVRQTLGAWHDMPIFQDLSVLLARRFAEMSTNLKAIVVHGNQIALALKLRLPRVFAPSTFSTDFGVRFQLVFDGVVTVAIGIPNITLNTYPDDFQVIQFPLSLTFPQDKLAIETLYNSYVLLDKSSSNNLNASIKEIRIVPNSAYIDNLTCAWCATLFHKLDLPSAIPAFKVQFDKVVMSVRNEVIHHMKRVKASRVSLSNRKALGIFTLQATLDMSSLGPDFEILSFPSTRLHWTYKTAKMGSIILPFGFQCEALAKHVAQLYMEFHVSQDVGVHSFYSELLGLLFSQRFKDHRLAFHGLTFSQASKSLDTFQPYHASVPLYTIYFLLKMYMSPDALKEKADPTISPKSLHLSIEKHDGLFLSTQLEVQSPIPISLDFSPFSLRMELFDMHAFHLVLPHLKIHAGDRFVSIQRAEIRNEPETAFEPIMVSLIPSERKSILPSSALLSSFRFLNRGSGGAIQKPPVPSLDTFSKFRYLVKWDKENRLVPYFDLTKLYSIIKDIVVHSIVYRIVSMELPLAISAEITVEYDLDESISVDVDFISFDLFLDGEKQYHCRIHVDKSQNPERKRVRFDIRVQAANDPIEIAEECQIKGMEETIYCIRQISFDPAASIGNVAFPFFFVFLKSNVSQYFTILQKYMDFKNIQMSKGSDIELDQMWSLVSAMAFKNRSSGVPSHNLRSAVYKLTDTELVFEFIVETERLSNEVTSLELELLLSADVFPILPLKTKISNHQDTGISSIFTITTEITLLDLSAFIRSFDYDDIDPFLKKRDPLDFKTTRHKALLQRLLTKALSLKVTSGTAKGFVGFVLKTFVGYDISIPRRMLDTLLFDDQWKNIATLQFENILQSLLITQLDVSPQNVVLKSVTHPGIGFEVRFKLRKSHTRLLLLKLAIPSGDVEVLVDNTRIGILTLQNSFACENCIETELTTAFSYYAESRSESKLAFASLIHALFEESPSPMILSFSNFRIHAQPSRDTTLLNLLYYSLSTQALKTLLRDSLLPYVSSVSENANAKRSEKDLKEAPKGLKESLLQGVHLASQSVPFWDPESVLEPEFAENKFASSLVVHLHAMAFYFETDTNFVVGIFFPSLVWKQGRFLSDGAQFLIETKDEEVPFTTAIDPSFTFTNLKIAGSTYFPILKKDDATIDGFSAVKLHSDHVKAYFPFESLSELSLERLSLSQDLADGNLFSAFAALEYGRVTTQYFPNVKVELPVNSNLQLSIQNSVGGFRPFATRPTSFSATLSRKRNNTYCDALFISEPNGRERFCIYAFELGHADVFHNPSLWHFQSNGLVLYMDTEVKAHFYALTLRYLTRLVEQHTINFTPAPLVYDDSVFTKSPFIPSPSSQESIFTIDLALPAFCNLDIALDYVHFELDILSKPTKDAEKNVFFITLRHIFAKTDRTLFKLSLHAFIRHLPQNLKATKKPLSAYALHDLLAHSTISQIELAEPPSKPKPNLFHENDLFFKYAMEHYIFPFRESLRTTWTEIQTFASELVTSSIELKHSKVQLVEMPPRLDWHAYYVVKFPDSKQSSKGSFRLRILIDHFDCSIEDTKVAPKEVLVDGMTGVYVHFLVDLPNDSVTGELPAKIQELLFPPETEAALKSSFDIWDTDLSRSKLYGSSGSYEFYQSDDDLGGDLHGGNNIPVAAHKPDPRLPPSSRATSFSIVLKALYFRSTSPIHVDWPLTLPAKWIDLDPVFYDLDAIVWDQIHLNCSDKHLWLHFRGPVNSKLALFAHDHVLSAAFTLNNELFAHIAVRQFELSNGIVRGVLKISFPTEIVSFQTLLLEKQPMHLSAFRLSSLHSEEVRVHTLLSRRKIAVTRLYEILNEFPLDLFFDESASRIYVFHPFPFSIEIPFALVTVSVHRPGSPVSYFARLHLRTDRSPALLCIARNDSFWMDTSRLAVHPDTTTRITLNMDQVTRERTTLLVTIRFMGDSKASGIWFSDFTLPFRLKDALEATQVLPVESGSTACVPNVIYNIYHEEPIPTKTIA